MSHCTKRYRSEEISPTAGLISWVGQTRQWLQQPFSPQRCLRAKLHDTESAIGCFIKTPFFRNCYCYMIILMKNTSLARICAYWQTTLTQNMHSRSEFVELEDELWMWCFHLGVQTPINPFHHCFTILMMKMAIYILWCMCVCVSRKMITSFTGLWFF